MGKIQIKPRGIRKGVLLFGQRRIFVSSQADNWSFTFNVVQDGTLPCKAPPVISTNVGTSPQNC